MGFPTGHCTANYYIEGTILQFQVILLLDVFIGYGIVLQRRYQWLKAFSAFFFRNVNQRFISNIISRNWKQGILI